MKVVKKVVKAALCAHREKLIEKYALNRADRRVADFKSIERAVKQQYQVRTKVFYIEEQYKDMFVDKDSTRGFYSTIRDYAVVFVNNNFKANVTTLCHELTHAYQNHYMHDQYIISTKALKRKEVSYWNAWHEVHARQQAEEMCEYFLGYDIAM